MKTGRRTALLCMCKQKSKTEHLSPLQFLVISKSVSLETRCQAEWIVFNFQ